MESMYEEGRDILHGRELYSFFLFFFIFTNPPLLQLIQAQNDNGYEGGED